MRLIDADALIDRMYHDAFETDTDMQRWDSGCWIRYKMFENAIDDAPTIDAVEVVRCGECRHKYMKDFDMFCPHMVGILKPNMHCSYGEREGE